MPRSKSASPEPEEDFEAVPEGDRDGLDTEVDLSPMVIAELEEAEIEEDVEAVGDGQESKEDLDEEDDESEYEGDEREPTLDEILKERSGLAETEEGEEEEEEEQEDEDEDNDSLTRRVLLGGKGEIGKDEFVCKSCFLVKHRSQLAESRRQLCRDCL